MTPVLFFVCFKRSCEVQLVALNGRRTQYEWKMTFRDAPSEERASASRNHLYNADQMWQFCIAFDCTWPTPAGRQIEIWNISLQFRSLNKDNSQAEHTGRDEGWEWCDMALIFPSGGIYHISFNNAESFRGHCWPSQPFRKELKGLSGHWTGSV